MKIAAIFTDGGVSVGLERQMMSSPDRNISSMAVEQDNLRQNVIPIRSGRGMRRSRPTGCR